MTTQALVLRTIGEGSALPRLMPREFKPRRRAPSTGFLTSGTSKARVIRRGTKVLLGVILLSFLTLGGTSNPVSPTGGSQAANAFEIFPDCLMADDINDPHLTVRRWPGTTVFADGTVEDGSFNYYTADYRAKWGNVTGYEWYGTAGIHWNVEKYQELGISCPPVSAVIGGFISNLVLDFDAVLATGALTAYGWAMDRNVFGVFVGLVAQLLDTAKDGLFLNFLPVVIVLVAFWMVYQGLIKQRSSTAIQGVVWVIATSTAALVLFTKPEEVTTAVNGYTSTLGTQITSTIVDSSTDDMTGGELCAVQAADPNPVLRMSQCVIWETFLFVPWAQGQFGVLATQGIDVEGADPVLINGVDKGTTMPLVYMDSHVYNHNQSVPMSENPPESDYTKKLEQYKLVLAMFNQVDGEDEAGLINEPYRVAFDSFSGEDWTNRLAIAIVALIALAFAAVPLLMLSFSILVYQLGLVMLFLISPLFFMVGVHPGFGRKILLGWVEMVLSNLLKRLGTAFILGVLMMLYIAAMTYNTNFFFKVFLVILVSLMIMSIRGKILNQLSTINLGGGGKGDPSRKVAGALLAPVALTAGAIGAGFGAKSKDRDASFGKAAARYSMNKAVPGGIPNPVRTGYKSGKKSVPAGAKPKKRTGSSSGNGTESSRRRGPQEEKDQKTQTTESGQDRRTGPRYSEDESPLFDLDDMQNKDRRTGPKDYSGKDGPLPFEEEEYRREDEGDSGGGGRRRRRDDNREDEGDSGGGGRRRRRDDNRDEDRDDNREDNKDSGDGGPKRPRRRRPQRPSSTGAVTAAAAGAAAALVADGGILSGNEQLASLNRIERHLQKMSEAMLQLVNQGEDVKRYNDDATDATRRAETRAEKDETRADTAAQKQDRVINQIDELRNQGETLNRETRDISESARNAEQRAQKVEQSGATPDPTRTAASPFAAPPGGEPTTTSPAATVVAPNAQPSVSTPQGGQQTVFQNSNVTVQAGPGAPGSSGSSGAAGAAGAAGVGTPGPAGPQGERGYTGQTGQTGFAGRTGNVGNTGAAGLRGTEGARGFRGYDGATGESGATGSTGSTGQAGMTGQTGSQGPRGFRGDPGPAGQGGATGNTGSTGRAGMAGQTGAQGTRGSQGQAGMTGNTGQAGMAGQPGNQGATGRRGNTGQSGSGASTGSTESAPSTPKRPKPPASGGPKRPSR